MVLMGDRVQQIEPFVHIYISCAVSKLKKMNGMLLKIDMLLLLLPF